MNTRDEAIAYDYHGLLVPPGEEWGLAAELRARHFLHPGRLKEMIPRLQQVRSQVAAERELDPRQLTPDMKPLDAGFIDLPQKTLEEFRQKADGSSLGRILAHATRLRQQVGRVVFLGIGGSYLGARALFDALCNTYHNELPTESRLGSPRIYFEGNNVDNDSLQDLLDLFQTTCVDPNVRDEAWAIVVISKSGETLETAAAFRILRREAAEHYGRRSERLRQLIVPVTGARGRLRDMCKADGYTDADMLTIPDNVGGRFSIFTPVGLLPAAIMGLDVRALLLGAAAMTKRFLEEPFDNNPVLQFAGVNYLMTEELGKPIRVLSIWSKKLEALGWWYDQLLAESLGKRGRGPTPLTFVGTRDLHSRGQQHQDGPRDKLINNLVIGAPRSAPIALGMSDRDEDGLNAFARKTVSDVMTAAEHGTNQAYADAARPTADLILPMLSEHTLGQLMQMLMLATVVEGRLMGVNPYGQPGVEAYKRNMQAHLRNNG